MSNSKVKKSISDLMSDVKKKFGEDVVTDYNKKIERLSSQSLGLDYALGGGWPVGRLIELFGWESSGKSTLALYACIAVQAKGEKVIYIDVECAMDFEYAASLGVDINPENFIVFTPTTAEDALDLVKQSLDIEGVGLTVLDSVAAMVPRCILNGEVGEAKMGVAARLMSQTIPTLVKPAEKNNTTIIFINQLREKIGVMFGNPETTNGGNALKFYTSVRCNVAKSKKKKDDGEVVGNLVKVKVEKNKTAPPARVAEFDIVYGEGIDFFGELISLAEKYEIVEKKGGGHYSFNGIKLGQGVEKVRIYLEDHTEILEEINELVKESLKSE